MCAEKLAGVTNCTTEEELGRMIREASFVPKDWSRKTEFRPHFLAHPGAWSQGVREPILM
jgi:hypothetical protein